VLPLRAIKLKKMAKIQFGQIKVDSLKILIPMLQVEVIDGKFNEKYTNLKVFESGEVIEELNRNTNTWSDSKGIKVKLEVVKIKFGAIKEKGNQGEDFLVFQPSSKMLKQNYFDGINLHNLPTIYEYLMSLNILRFSYESLLQARFKDVDFCVDYSATPEEFRSINRTIELNVLQDLKHFVKSFDKHLGLQFNERQKATPTRPFVKTYHKSAELINNSNEFYCEFLRDNHSEEIDKGIGRYEITVKDAKFKKHYKIESVTINELFNISYSQIKTMFGTFLPNYIQKATRIEKMGKITPTETMHFNCIEQFINDGKSQDEIMNIMLRGIEERSALSRSKKLLQDLFLKVNNQDKLKQNNESKKEQDDFYRTIGLYTAL
jgi:hypothetical protein